MSIEAGDKVQTHFGEFGYVRKPVEGDTVYDWWVEIRFNAKGRERVSLEPYRTSELEKISEK